jgi:type I restriction enzyme M protein
MKIRSKTWATQGRNGGEYYTPRPLITTIVKVLAPQIGDKPSTMVLVGSAGFLVRSVRIPEKHNKNRSTTQRHRNPANQRTSYGKEKKSLAYIIGTMNMILHGVEAPNIIHTNTLSRKPGRYTGKRPL